MKPKTICTRLTLQHGKVLRYICSRGIDPTAPGQVVNKISWSDLPHSLLEAKKCFDDLEKLGLIEKRNKKYWPKNTGIQVVAYADKAGLWRKPPPPHVINAVRRNK